MFDIISYNFGTMFYLAVQWIISIVLVRLGGFGDAGIFSLAMTQGMIFGMIANYGLRPFQVSDINNTYTESSYILSRIITTFTASVLCCSFLFFSSYNTTVRLCIIAYLIYKSAEAINDVLSGIWQKKEQMPKVSFSLIAKGFVNLISFCIVYYFTRKLVYSVFAMAISSCFVLFSYDISVSRNIFKKEKLTFKPEKRQIISLLKYGMLTMLYTLTVSIINGIPKLVLERISSVDLLGVFSSIFTPTVVISTFSVGILIPIAPKIAEYFLSFNKTKAFKLFSICNITIVSVGLITELFSILFGKQVLKIVFGKEILEYFNLLYYLIVASCLIALVNCCSTFLISIRRLNALLTFSVLTCIIEYALCILLIPRYSIYGAAYAMIIASALQFIAETIYILKIILSLRKTPDSIVESLPSAVVTGCTGSVGVALIEKLVDEGYTVYAVLNPESKRNSNIPENEKVKKIFCGIDEYQKLPDLVKEKCSLFFHLAWAGTFGDGRNNSELQQKNTEFSLDAVRAAKALGCEVFVGVGSQAEYGRVNEKLTDSTPTNPENEYGKAKLIASQKTRELCNELGIRHEWVRLLSVYGPFDHEKSLVYSAISQLKSGVNPEYTPAEQIWDLLYCEDAANAIYLIAKSGKPNEIYVVGSGEEKPLKEYIEIIHRVVNPDIKPVFGQKEYSENQVMYLCADIEKLEKDTGFKQNIPFEDGIKRMAKEIK